MAQRSQYREDNERLASLIERHTGIPKKKTLDYVRDYGVDKILSGANILCSTEYQRTKLNTLYEFKNLYETIKNGELKKKYTLNSTEAAREYFRGFFADKKDKEQVYAAYVDSEFKVITSKIVSNGTLGSAVVHSREVLKEALFCNAAGIFLAHNHPSGNLTISPQDIEITNKLCKVLSTAEISLFDHIIVGDGKTVSLRDSGDFDPERMKERIDRALSVISENQATYESKPPSIKTQLALAERQKAIDSTTQTKNTKSHSRDER